MTDYGERDWIMTDTLLDRLRKAKLRPAILLDISASMNDYVEGAPHKKIDALRKIVNALKGPLKLYAFNTAVIPVSRDTIPAPAGGTYLSIALDRVKLDGYTEVIVVTDGEVNRVDQPRTLDALAGLKLKILYVGAGQKPPFLQQIADMTEGFCEQENLVQTNELTERIQLLLGPASEAIKL